MPVGKIVAFTKEKGFGFIQGRGDADIFFHRSSVIGQFMALSLGQEVQYELDPAAEKPRAKSVAALGDAKKSSMRSLEVQNRAERPRADYEYGFVTKLYRSKAHGFISSVKNGPEYRFEFCDVTGDTPYYRLDIGQYVRFVAESHLDDANQPIAKSVEVTRKPVADQEESLGRHPRARRKKPSWR